MRRHSDVDPITGSIAACVLGVALIVYGVNVMRNKADPAPSTQEDPFMRLLGPALIFAGCVILLLLALIVADTVSEISFLLNGY